MDGQHLAWTLVLGLLLLWQPAVAAKEVKCSLRSLCLFDCGDFVMDLTALKNTVFKDVTDFKGQNQFSYSPCAKFSEGTGCFKTHVCQKSDILSNTNKTIDVGSEVKASLNPYGGPSYFTYTHTGQDKKAKVTKVTVKCTSANEIMAKDPLLTIAGEYPDGSGHYEMTLKSQHACFKAKATTTTKAMTSGTTRVTTKQTTQQTTSTRHVTTEQTTAATTPTRQPTTVQTTPPATSHSTHVTTEPATTPSKGNSTTEPTPNATTEVTTAAMTTPASGNVTTPGTNATTTVVVTTAIKNETTTVYVTSPGSSAQTTQGGMTTAPTGGASTPSLSSQTMVLLGMLSAAVAALNRL